MEKRKYKFKARSLSYPVHFTVGGPCVENKTLTPQEALRALPDWLEKEKHNFTINLEDRYPVGSHDLVDDCFQRCFELMSERLSSHEKSRLKILLENDSLKEKLEFEKAVSDE